MRAWIALGILWMLALACAAIVILNIGAVAWAHDWYTGRTDAQGRSCCGVWDCAPIPPGRVVEGPGGYQLLDLATTIPYGVAQDSPDGQYHVCIVGGKVRCFFAPLGSY